MGEAFRFGLGYGALGEPFYNAEDRKWTFERSLSEDIDVCVLSGGHDGLDDGETPQAKNEDPARGTGNAKNLSSEVHATRDLARVLEQESRRIAIAEACDPAEAQDDFLTFCTIRDKQTPMMIQVAVYVSDPAKLRLCVRRVYLQRKGWDQDRCVFLQVPHIAGDTGSWTSPSPVQQIVSGDGSAASKGHVAVRTVTHIFLLRLAFCDPSTTEIEGNRLETLVVHVEPVIASPFITVAINAWFAHHILTIDRRGRWKVIEATRRRDLDAKVITRGRLCEPGEVNNDGWYKAHWIRDADTILACSRSRLWLLDVPSGAITEETSVLASLAGDLVMLDVRRDPSDEGRVFILTQSYIFYLSIDRGTHALSTSQADAKSSPCQLSVLLSIRHFRHAMGHALQMQITALMRFCLLVTVYDRDSRIATQWKLTTGDEDGSSSTSTSNAAIITLPKSKEPLFEVSFLHAAWDDMPTSEYESGLGDHYRKADVSFAQLILLFSGLDIKQQLSAIVPRKCGLKALQAPHWQSKIRMPVARVRKETFITDDYAANELDMSSAYSLISSPYKVDFARPTVDYGPVYRALIGDEGDGNPDATTAILRIDHSALDDDMYQLVTDIIGTDVEVSDLDDVQIAFEQLLLPHASSDIVTDSRSRLRPIARSSVLFGQSNDLDQIDIRSLYDAIISRWLTPLNADVPGRTRLAREKIARRIAAQLCLSSYAFHPSLPAVDSETLFPATESATQHDSLQLQSSQLLSSQLPSSQLQSSQPSSQHPSQPPSTKIDTYSTALSRLQRYTPLGTTSTPASSGSTTISIGTILAHWSPNTSPETYSFERTSADLRAQAQREEDLAGLTDRERERIERRRVRHELRRQREAEKVAFSSQVSAAEPVVVVRGRRIEGAGMSSVDTGMGMGMSGGRVQSQSQSYSQAGAGELGSSQVMRGQPPRKKAKKRTQGF